MNGSAAFDTLAYSEALEKAGFPQAQAQAMAKAQKEAFGQILAYHDLATKADLARLETRLVKWMVGLIISLGAFLSALLLGLAGRLQF